MKRFIFVMACVAAVSLSGVRAAEPTEKTPNVSDLRSKAVNYLKTTQNDDGTWTSRDTLGVTAAITVGMLDGGLTEEDPAVAKALKYLASQRKPDGGIYAEGSTHRNYETCLAMTAFDKAGRNGKYDELVAGAQKFLKQLQWDEGEGLETSDVAYGGAGYGSRSRPDLSNTGFFIEALKSTGIEESDPAMQKALIFVSRCQNLESEHNTTPFAAKVDDGGFYYTIAAGGASMAGTTPEGGLRSYGSMTYAGLKSMIYAGLSKDDPRVAAATEWAKRHYTLKENPGMGQQGLYYYYMTFARALEAAEIRTLTDAQEQQHDWAAELLAELASRQKPNGSWVNDADRWMEGDPNLVTAYVLIALQNIEESPAKK